MPCVRGPLTLILVAIGEEAASLALPQPRFPAARITVAIRVAAFACIMQPEIEGKTQVITGNYDDQYMLEPGSPMMKSSPERPREMVYCL